MKRELCSVVALFLATALAGPVLATEKRFNSPDGKIEVVLNDEGGRPTYQVNLQGTPFLNPSPLGLKLNFADLTQGLTLKDCAVKTVSDQYELKTWKQSHVSYEATEAVCQFEQDGRKALDIIFRVSNRDVAFRYQLYPKRGRGGETLAAVIEGEASGFVLPQGTTTFLCPQSKPMTGFARTAPSYETSYAYDEEMGKNGWGDGYTFPCLFRESGGWLLISETGNDGGYVGCHLENNGGGNYRIAFPNPAELNGFGTSNVQTALPAFTPWRTITLGTTLAPIVESTVANDLVQPKYEASKDYTYGKGSWSWIIGMDASCNFDEQKRYIDFSAAMGYRSVLVDALWDTQIGYERMAELSRYAQSKGVGLFLWYNSNGAWNDAPQGPRHKMDKSAARRKEMAWMKQNGILGIKVDFFGSDKQPMMQLYEDILTDANEFGIQVIFHGCTLPRGWERMYPNYCSSEAVLASENLVFSQGFCEMEARHACLHPFVRNAVASMEYGGTVLQRRLNRNADGGSTRRTSDVFELATAIAFQSSGQNFALTPRNLKEQPAFEIDFMRHVPTTWDETRFIDGYPGRYVVMARRHADRWYVIALNAEEAPKTLTIDLSALEGFTIEKATLLHDGPDGRTPQQGTPKVDRRGRLRITLQPQCAAIVY